MLADEKRLKSLDFLRGIAILAVISVHVRQQFPTGLKSLDNLMAFGSYGVQLFFFISAFTMCHVWDLNKKTEGAALHFYQKRAVRIVPLFWIAILFYAVERQILGPSNINPTSFDYVLTFLFLHTFWPPSFNNVVPGGWSIGIEMTFYLFFPILMRYLRSKKENFLLLAVAIYFLNSFFLSPAIPQIFENLLPPENSQLLKDFSGSNFFNQAPIFLTGCFLFYSRTSGIKISGWTIILLWTAFVLFLKIKMSTSGLFFTHCLMIAAFFYSTSKSNISFLFINKLGQRSYSIYLTHFFLIDITKHIIKPENSNIATTFLILFLITLSSYALATQIEGYANPFFENIFLKKNLKYKKPNN